MKKNNFLKFSVIVTLFFVSMVASTNITTPGAATTNAVKNVAIVFSTGGLGDKSFNDAGFAGAQRANDTTKVNIDYVEPKDVPEINSFIESFSASTDPIYDLVIAIGFSSADGVNKSSLSHNATNFAIIDMVVDNPNVASIVFKEEQGSFLVGAMAAMTTKTNVIGFLGGLNIDLINRFRYGFEQGARYINPNIKVLAQYSPDASNPWNDVAGGKSVANDFISKDADVIYAAAGGTGLGVFDAAKEAEAEGKTVYGIGVDSDQDGEAPGYVLASMVKRVDVAVENLITDTIAGTFKAGFQSLGLAENGVGISEMKHTTFIKDSICTGTKSRYQVVQDIKADIVAGSIVVNGTGQDAADYNTVSHACTEPVPDRPSGSSSATGTTTSPGFELPLLVVSFVAIVIINKRRK